MSTLVRPTDCQQTHDKIPKKIPVSMRDPAPSREYTLKVMQYELTGEEELEHTVRGEKKLAVEAGSRQEVAISLQENATQ